MSNQSQYIIRNMMKSEVESVAVEWATIEGWNPGIDDVSSFFETDPEGFFVGLLDGKPIACISAVAYDSDFGFIGFYIVKEEYRGKGYGIQIWNKAIEYLRTQNIGLDGVIEQQENYKKSGFKLAYSNIRYEGETKKVDADFDEIIPLSEVQFDEILDYDTKLFPVPRPTFLKSWIKQPNSIAFAAIDDNKLIGYSVIRKCRSGYKIGPLFANDRNIANKLFLKSISSVEPGFKVYLDTPEVNIEAVKLAESFGMSKVFGTARMYTKLEPKMDLNKVFGVSTFELG